ncbi:MAG: hypothetical protein GC150_05305 [Rhizobiales bacterium]|nr:hypothetical protein [Hyphomicrobiales bacterium]
MIVFDGSGSMWGELDGVNKVGAARASIIERLPAAARRLDLGLVAFGHRRKSDCSDAELLRPIAPGGADELGQLLAGVSPRGRTPLATALDVAGQALEDRGAIGEETATAGGDGDDAQGPRSELILLVVDGFENCKRDPCETASELLEQRAGLRIEALALNPKDAELEGLACFGRGERSRLTVVRSRGDLEEGLDRVLKSPQDEVRPVAVPVTPPARPTGPPRLVLSAVLAPDNMPIDEPVQWRVVALDQETRERMVEARRLGRQANQAAPAGSRRNGADQGPDSDVLFAGTAINPVLDAPPGRYRVEIGHGLATAGIEVEVAELGDTRIEAAIEAAKLALVAHANPGSPLLDGVFFTLHGAPDSETSEIFTMSREVQPQYVLPPGSYQVSAQYGLSRTETTVSLSPGDDRHVELYLYVGALAVSADDGNGGTLGNVLFIVEEDDPGAASGRREVARSAAPSPVFTLPANVYHVTATRGLAQVRRTFTVQPGQVTRRRLELAAATIDAAARLGSEGAPLVTGVTYRVYREGEATDGETFTPVLTTARPKATLELTPGRYRIVGTLTPGNALATTSVRLGPGDHADITLVYEAGEVALALSDPNGLKIVRDVYWRVVDAQGRPVWQSGSLEPRAFLAPGRYTVTAEHRDRAVTADITVAAGEAKEIALTWR